MQHVSPSLAGLLHPGNPELRLAASPGVPALTRCNIRQAGAAVSHYPPSRSLPLLPRTAHQSRSLTLHPQDALLLLASDHQPEKWTTVLYCILHIRLKAC